MQCATRIPTSERGPRVWQAIESSATQQLARMAADGAAARGFVSVLDLWDEVMGMHWPPGSRFPSHFSARVGTLALGDWTRSRPWLNRLRRRAQAMAGEPGPNPYSAVVAAEEARVKNRIGGLGTSR